MEPIRLATDEEVKHLQSLGIDFDFCNMVLAFGKGEDALYSLIKSPTEIYTYPMDVISDRRKLMFMWGMENAMRVNRIPSYYFQVEAGADKETWRKNLENFGAVTTTAPQFRYKKVLG